MQRKRRSKIEIIADILEILSNGCRPPTRLAAEANLAYDRMTNIVDKLVERGLLKKDLGELCITPEGFRFLQSYRQWRHLLDTLGL
ncbi:MAG: winged helix-turn-helix domain-containing protein [Pyrobaculum sp.]